MYRIPLLPSYADRPMLTPFVPAVNPEISSGLPIPDMNRYPQPGSREERYATPATQASDVAFNPVRLFLLFSGGTSRWTD